jgi:hypothetical protein
MNVACRDRRALAVMPGNNQTARLVDGFEDTFNCRSVRVDRDHFTKSGGAIQPEAADIRKALPLSQMPWNSAHESDSAVNKSPALAVIPSADSDAAG